MDAAGTRTERTADYFVMAAPIEVARKIMGWELQRQDPAIGEFQHLSVIPMGSLHITLNRKLTNVPRAPVFFKGGRYALSFIDMSQVGAVPSDKTILSFVTSNSVELVNQSADVQYEALMGEVTTYTGITTADVESWQVVSNAGAPLAVNDVQAWPNRPDVRSAHLTNLLYACDWAKTPVDLCCMEGAVFAGMTAAREIGLDLNRNIPAPVVAPQYPRWLMRVLTCVLYPIVPVAYVWSRLFEGGSSS